MVRECSRCCKDKHECLILCDWTLRTMECHKDSKCKEFSPVWGDPFELG